MPTVAAVTLTLTVHTLALGIPAFVRDNDVLVVDVVPPQLLTTLGVAAMVRPLGKLSVTFALVNGVVVGLISVMVKTAVPPGAIAAGENDLLILGP